MLGLNVRELAEIIGGQWSQTSGAAPLQTPVAVSGQVEVDAARIRPGDVFWALETGRQDSASRLQEAFAHGAAGVVAGTEFSPPPDRWGIVVEDPQWALWRLARHRRQAFSGRIVAVAGGLAKTSFQQMLHAALSHHLNGSAPQRSWNDRLGTVLEILQLETKQNYAVLELNPQGPGEMESMAHLCQPQIGVVLHRFSQPGSFESQEAALLKALPEGGFAVFNGDDPGLRRLAERIPARTVLVGRGPHCDTSLSRVGVKDGRLVFSLEGTEFSTPLWGRHHLHSVLAVYEVGKAMGISVEDLKQAISQLETPPGRCQVIRWQSWTVVDDTYDQRPESLLASLELLRELPPARRIVVCGEINQGGWRERRSAGRAVVTHGGADWLLAYGGHGQEITQAAREAGMPVGRSVFCRGPEQTATKLQSLLAPDDTILVKGEGMRIMEILQQRSEEALWEKTA